jgi:transposase-like protein
MARPRKYSDELRRRAIEEVIERGRKVPEVARDLVCRCDGTHLCLFTR